MILIKLYSVLFYSVLLITVEKITGYYTFNKSLHINLAVIRMLPVQNKIIILLNLLPGCSVTAQPLLGQTGLKLLNFIFILVTL